MFQVPCHPSVFIVNFEYPSHLFLIFSTGDFEQVINCYYIIFTFLYSNFVASSKCLSIYTLILNFTVNRFTFKSSKAVLQWVFCNSCIFSCLDFNLMFFTFTEFCTILTQFEVIQDGLKLIFRVHGKNMPNYTRVEISTLSLRQC